MPTCAAAMRCGDALLGVFDLAALEEGIPDEAYKPLTGDNKEAAKFYRERNKDAKKGQGQIDFTGGGGAMPPRRMAAGLGTIKAMPEETVGQVEKKRAEFEAWKADPARWNSRSGHNLFSRYSIGSLYAARITLKSRVTGKKPPSFGSRQMGSAASAKA